MSPAGSGTGTPVITPVLAGYGWFPTIDDAKDYFEDERLETSAWDDLSTDAKKGAALIQAYNRIYYSGLFSVPTYADASAEQLVILQKANAEMAYYLAQHLDDEDRRKGLQAQGVVGANIVGETYVRFASDTMDLKDLPIPPIVAHLLKIFSTTAHNFYVSPVDRDEDDDDMEL